MSWMSVTSEAEHRATQLRCHLGSTSSPLAYTSHVASRSVGILWRRLTVRRRLLAAIAAVLVVYLAVVTLYSLSGDVTTATGRTTSPPADGVTVILTPQSVNASTQTIDLDLSIRTSAQLTGPNGISPNRRISIVISPTTGAQSIVFARNEIPGTVPIAIVAGGEVESWPLDRYSTPDLTVVACADDCTSSADALKTRVYLEGHVPGWSLSGREAANGFQLQLDARRAASTIAFAVVLLALMIAMPCLVLFVAITTLAGRRKVEPSFMSWMAAMLFATVPLRTFLPGSPPIGSWIDFTIVLWVIVALVTGLGLYVTAWAREPSRITAGDDPPRRL